MKQNSSISVIMPVYNQGDYVGEAIESILNQTYADFEFIIVNDGSTDNTEDSILSYTDERIIYVKNERNVGNYPARNIGLQMAKGKYVAVMDADDIALPVRLERQFIYMEDHPEVSAIGSWFSFSDNLQRWGHPVEDEKIRITLLKDNCFMHASLLIRSEVLRKLNGYDEQFKYAADYDLICRIAQEGQVFNLPEYLMIYRRHSQQISQKHIQIQRMYAGKIRTRYQLSFIEHYGKKVMTCVDRYAVGNAEIGQLISMYVYARSKEDELIEEEADNLLDCVVDKIQEGKIEKSYPAGCGLLCLLRNNLVLGDEDENLKDLDKQLDWRCIAMNPDDKDSIYGWIHYLCLRIEGKKEEDDILLIRNKQNLISFLGYLDNMDTSKGNSILTEDIRKIDSMRLCPAITKRLLETNEKKEDVTFIIPVRIDSKERKTNLDWVVEQLSQRENTKILVLEADVEPCYNLKKKYEHVTCYFIEDHDPVFHRTRYLNQLISLAETSIIGVWDTDVVLPDKQIEEAITTICEKKAMLCYPYDGRFCSLSEQKSMLLKEETTFNWGSLLQEDLSFVATNSLGGAFFINRDFYLQAGGENEHFYGWGCEDLERCKRIEILGGTVSRISGKLYHLYHPRKENSWYGSKELEIRNRREFLKVCGMTKEELEKYIGTWKKNDISGSDHLYSGLSNKPNIYTVKHKSLHLDDYEALQKVIESQKELLKKIWKVSDYWTTTLISKNPFLHKISTKQPYELIDKEWLEFEKNFESVFPAFLSIFKYSFPNMSKIELYTCCLVKLKLKTNRIAALLGQKENTVSKRKKEIMKTYFYGTSAKSIDEFMSDWKQIHFLKC